MIGFFIGLFIGGTVGFLTCALLTAGYVADIEAKIDLEDLEELL